MLVTTQKGDTTMTEREAREITVTKAEAYDEISRHSGCSFDEFIWEVGDKDEYTGAEVLDWLGY